MELSIIIVSYNTRALLKDCLLSLKKNIVKRIEYEVIVVDNASSDGSSTMVEKEFVNVLLIKNEQNLGYAKGNNNGVKKAKGRYILFLNADTIVYPKTIETMIDFMDTYQDVGAATCKVMLSNGELDDASHRGFPTPWNSFCHFSGLAKLLPKSRLFAGYNMGYANFSVPHEIDSCSGAFMFVRREAGEQVRWWDEDFFWYGDDLDFCYRLKEKGWKILFFPLVKVLHYKGVSGGIKAISKHLTSATKETKIRATNARFAAMRLFYSKHYEHKYPKLVGRLVTLGVNIKRFFALRRIS